MRRTVVAILLVLVPAFALAGSWEYRGLGDGGTGVGITPGNKGEITVNGPDDWEVNADTSSTADTIVRRDAQGAGTFTGIIIDPPPEAGERQMIFFDEPEECPEPGEAGITHICTIDGLVYRRVNGGPTSFVGAPVRIAEVVVKPS